MTKSVAIIGGGPAGCTTALCLDKSFDITIFEKNSPLKTLLPTGGGKCNLAHAEYNFKELAKHYPRGEKFLYSAFSRFNTSDTIDFFENLGITTYTREDNRIFPTSNSSNEVREKFLAKLHHCKIKKEEALHLNKKENGIELKTNKATYLFDIVVIATGGKSSYELLKNLGHQVEPPVPSLVGLKTKPNYKELQGVSIKNCKITSGKTTFLGDLLSTDNGLTGPVIFELSSIKAKEKLPYEIQVDFLNKEIDWQKQFDKNPQKQLGNLLSEYLPKSFIKNIFKNTKIDLNEKCCIIKSNTKVLIQEILNSSKFEITGYRKDGETVTCGGYILDEFNPKTLESKLVTNIYACGEVLNIDGLCGGFNLQACWTTGSLVAQAINQK